MKGKRGCYTSAKGECVGVTPADIIAVAEDLEEIDEEAPSSPPVGVRALPGVVVVSSAQQFREKWWNTIVECAGAMAGCCTTAAFIPQVVEVAITGDTSGLSLPMYCIFVTGVVMWIVYGVCKRAGVGQRRANVRRRNAGSLLCIGRLLCAETPKHQRLQSTYSLTKRLQMARDR